MTHRAVAAAVHFDPQRVLVVRRREDARDFPAALALPSTLVGDGETPYEAVTRMGLERLGLGLFADRAPLAVGRFLRDYGSLEMTLYRCERRGMPQLMEAGGGPIYSAVMWMYIRDLARVALPDTCCDLLCRAHGLAVAASSTR